jgi:hypothetical protein
MESFPCTGCGCCCKRVDKVINVLELLNDYEKKLLKFPYTHTNGVCDMLTEDNKCSVYDDRPLICNIEKFAETFGFDKKEFYLLNASSCNKFMDEDNIDQEFRIKAK